jgi:hypothetical protein
MSNYGEIRLNNFNIQLQDLSFDDMEKIEQTREERTQDNIIIECYIHLPTNDIYKYEMEYEYWFENTEAGMADMLIACK